MTYARLVALVLLAGGTALVGCSSASHGGGSPTPTPTVPAKAQLKSGLLTAADLGNPFSAENPGQTPTTGTKTSGASNCRALLAATEGTASSPKVEVSADFSTDQFPSEIVSQSLLADSAASVDRGLTEIKDAFTSCRGQFMITNKDGNKLSFNAQPSNFAAGATGLRLDGSVDDVLPARGYMAIARISRTVVMLFAYYQVGDKGLPGTASQIFSTAKNKATRALRS